MKSGIYLITNVVNGKMYVGSSKSITKRKYSHFYQLEQKKHGNPHLQSSHDIYGKSAFHFEILEYCNIENLREREDWWIVLLGSRDPDKGYNLRTAERQEHSEETRAKISAIKMGTTPYNKGIPMSGEQKVKVSTGLLGNSNKRGKKVSEEAKARMSAAHIGKQSSLGRKCSEETKAKISAGNKNKKISEEMKAKISAALVGRKHTEQAKARMSIAQKGRKISAEHRARISASMKGRKRSEKMKFKMSTTRKVATTAKSFAAKEARS